MAASKNRMSLMTLPKNVRNQIYWLVMKPDADDEEDQEKYRWVDGTPVLILQSEGTDKYGADYCNDTKWWLQPAITKVSRKVRKEALPVYYGNIEFQIHGTGYIDQLDAAGESLSHIGKNARWIRHLRVFYQYDDMEDNLKQETLDFLKPIPASSIAMKMRRAPMSVLGRLGAELAGDLGEEYDDM
ncbi:hypothetical protein M409DRAFT_48374 [Zasmidium cellare ATCC 36951]|uniref:Uncharacterized protein n=1 Tax=Zasmidium cellare ATCC 36951 TaxID=1080233 RepID=A0A6A6D4U2_ZASCE|nr:uncharacterized protein M409DRAFT_48374 [Zasmidium cellare ATCC 36951]KAF2173390.1 hypothetical protein M409DRAFT_48374 [Zasmidium cellare ATCC 36951]